MWIFHQKSLEVAIRRCIRTNMSAKICLDKIKCFPLYQKYDESYVQVVDSTQIFIQGRKKFLHFDKKPKLVICCNRKNMFEDVQSFNFFSKLLKTKTKPLF